jgi:Cu/Ag efflux pump CusA
MPIFFLGGVTGAFFEPLGLSYLLAVFCSMAVALTLTPALGLMLLVRNARAIGDSPVATWLAQKYEGALRAAVGSPRRVVLAGGLAVLAGLAIWPFLGQSLLPALREGEVVVNWNTAPGTSHSETYRITARVSRELRALPGVRGVSAHVGRAVSGDQVVGINSSQIWVGLEPRANYAKTVAAIRETLEGYPGVQSNVQTYVRDKVSAALTGESNSIVVRVYGPKREIIARKAEEVRMALASMPGLVDLRAEGQEEEPQVQIKVDLDAAGRASVKPGDVRRSAATVFSGLGVGFLFDEQKIEDVVVWSAPEARRSLNDLRDLWVERGDRKHVRLADVANVSIVPTPTVIKHERIAPYVDVTANVSGSDLSAIDRELQTRLAKVEFPLEYHPEVLGEYAERLAVQRRMLGSAIAVLIGIFLLLQACFGSWRLAALGFAVLPVSIAGGVVAALVSGTGNSLGSIVGFLAILGVAARNGIFLIRHYQRLQETAPFAPDLVMRGARERLSPIVASSAAIVAALLPMAALGWMPGLEIARQIAIVIIGGVVTSALVSLFVVPALYSLVARGAERPVDLGLAAT